MAARGREEGRAVGEQLDDLHRRRGRARSASVRGRSPPRPPARWRPAAPPPAARAGQLGEQLAVAVERGDREAGARQVERDPARAGADLEHGPRHAAASASSRQSGRSAAYAPHSTSCQTTAAGVRPPPSHRQYSRARPRAPRAARAARAAPCRSAGRTAGPGRRPARRRAPRRGPRRPAGASGRHARVLHPQRQLGGPRPDAGHVAHVAGEQLPVGVPDPRDVAAVGDAVVEDAEQVERPVRLGLERERAQDLVGAGRVLDQQQRRRPARQHERLRAAERRLDGLDTGRDRLEPHVQRVAQRGGRERVVDVVEAGERAARRARCPPACAA